MIDVRCENSNIDPANPAHKAARQRDAWGRLRPGVGTLGEMLRRVAEGDPVDPWGVKARSRFIATLASDAAIVEAARLILGVRS